MDAQMYHTLSLAIAFAVAVLLIGAGFFANQHHELYPVIMFGWLGISLDLILNGHPISALTAVLMFMSNLYKIIVQCDRDWDNRHAAQSSAMPEWARHAPDAQAALESRYMEYGVSREQLQLHLGRRPGAHRGPWVGKHVMA
jgi:hypothetical protein